MLHKLPVVSVDIYDIVELMTVEISVADGTDTDMFKMIFNIIALETEISNFMSYIQLKMISE